MKTQEQTTRQFLVQGSNVLYPWYDIGDFETDEEAENFVKELKKEKIPTSAYRIIRK
jgi:hypothetical protein